VSYPLPTATTSPMTSRRQTTALLAAGAAVLYLAGYYLPLLDIGGDAGSFSDGDSSGLWVWVVPSVLALLAALLSLGGKPVGAAIAAGITTGLAGLTTFELLFIHRFAEQMSAGGFGSAISKGIGFWALTLAVVLAVAAALSLMTANSGEPMCNQLLAVVGGIAGIGISLAILLPVDGVSILDIDDGMIQFGVIVWAVLAPLLALMMAASGRRAGVAFAMGVGLGHLGFTVAVLQDIGSADDSFALALSTSHTAIYHWAALLSVAFTAAALTQVQQPSSPVSAFTVGTAMPGYVPVSPGQPGYAPTYTVQAAYQQQVAPQPVAPQQPSSQWAPDPYSRHQFRLWDGHTWTEHVADQGVVGHDPIS